MAGFLETMTLPSLFFIAGPCLSPIAYSLKLTAYRLPPIALPVQVHL